MGQSLSQGQIKRKNKFYFTDTRLVIIPLKVAAVLTMFPLVASPSRPPNVMTGDMQAQYRKRMDAKHCRLTASLMSLHRNGAFLRMSFTKPPKILSDTRGPHRHFCFTHATRQRSEGNAPARPLQLRSRVMLRLLHRVRAVGGAVRERRHLPLLLQRRTSAALSSEITGRGFGLISAAFSPGTGRSLAVRSGCWGPIHPEAAP